MSDNLFSKEQPQHYLLVEGDDDMQVMYHLLKHHNLHEQLKIKKKDGINILLADLKTELKGSGVQRLGIIVDANTDIQNRWQSLRNRLIESGYGIIPTTPQAEGTIIQQDERPTVGIWLMPTNTVSGMLEDFVSFLVPQGDILWPIAGTVLQQVITQDCRFPPTQKSKAHIHTWLAWQEEPGKPMGQAITKRYLDAAAPDGQRFIQWIRKLFDLEAV